MASQTSKHTNRLAREKSPYLLQHAHNPVDWYAWGAEAFEKAKNENKPIFLSIGYSTCHWCHVMERESFENAEIARVMNEHFVNIKVDREERPDVDQIYMTAVQAMTGGGGWPMSVFLTPDREPFFGGTYFPPDRRWGRPGFKEVLLEISRMWREEKKRVVEWGAQLSQAIREEKSMSGGELSEATLRRAYQVLTEIYDPQEGGFGGAPKFPRSETISLLLRIYRRTGERHALTMVTRTLEKMSRGGIYDHLGGGFHRYSTDAHWLVPHFEKMLYDNALLAKSCLEAYLVIQGEITALALSPPSDLSDACSLFEGIARETLDYVLREMTSREGGFYSAEDADSEGVEGKYYVWTEEELQKILTPEEFKKVREVFQTSPQGNYEGKNILHLQGAIPWSVRGEPPLKEAIKKLLTHRAKRIPPYKDDKVLASWNGLMITAMAYAHQVLGDERYLRSATGAADFILKNMWDGKSLKRRYREGDTRYHASLEDYAFVIQGLLGLYEADFNMRWFEVARLMQARVDELFWDSKNGGYFSTDMSDATLIARVKDIYDGAIPSGNSIEALNLLKFYSYTLDDFYQKRAEGLLRTFSGFVNENPQASPALLMAVDYVTDLSKEIVIAGLRSDPKVGSFLQKIHHYFLPNRVIALSDKPGLASFMPLLDGKVPQEAEATLYVCEGHVCQRPVFTWEEAQELLKNFRPYKLN